MYKQRVARGDLAQPGILTAPAMIHMHWPLGQRMQGVIRRRIPLFQQRRIPEGKRIKILFDPGAQMIGRLKRAVPARREAEFLQGFGINLHHHRSRHGKPAHTDSLFQIGFVGKFVVGLLRCEFLLPETAILDIGVELRAVRRAASLPGSIRPAPAREWSDIRRAFMMNQIIGIAAGIERRPRLPDKTGQPQPDAEIEQNILKRPHVAVRLKNRLTNGIGRAMGARYRPVQQRNAIPPLQIGGIGQHQIRIGDRFR